MLLLYLILLPFFGSIICCKSERVGSNIPRWIALFVTGLLLILTLFIWKYYHEAIMGNYSFPNWPIEYILHWIPHLGISLHLALDGLSWLMILLVDIIGILSVLCSWYEVDRSPGFFYCNLLLVLGSVIGVFLSIDLFCLFFFWELILFPMYLLITIWGYPLSPENIRVIIANKFVIYAKISGLLMLVAILTLSFIYYHSHGVLSFNYVDLLGMNMPLHIEFFIMLFFFLSFAIKLPIVPFHSWLSDAHSQTSMTGSIDLVGLLPKTAAYGILRFVLPLFPHASHQFAPIAMWIGVVCIFYGACIAFSQTNIKRFLAYTTLSHMGFILIALYSGNQIAYQGAIVYMIAHSLSMAGLCIIYGQLYDRVYTRDMKRMGGLWNQLGWSSRHIPACSLFFATATLGIPCTGNFVGEIMILFGSFASNPFIAVLSTLGLILASIYSLVMIQRIYYGQPRKTFSLKKTSSSSMEWFLTMSIIILLIFIGIFPQYIIRIAFVSTQHIHAYLSQTLHIE
ncbi:NADH-quinone oxidoreductase subunit M [Candidatus Schneideria nysicola]|uniref:NADH-quinone oxidoreductase subunit M n=1 Tax=Candidatus Schneideria nysicola TaxID=1081631 RepID=UPI001CAA63DB|nr:NADH-quinone oxidoreductase subunit M [Candidatus Schneideria nysicola]UAJ65518.1 NADH-quinone oxidoreductase subunit M [Candidatus Schneideria nysicola]